MQLKINDVVIAGDGEIGPQGLHVNGQILPQPAEFLRAEEIKVFNRKNARTVIAFARTQRFDDLADAEVFLWEHCAEVLIQGLLTITAKSETKEVERYIQNALCRSYNAHQLGVTIFTDYEILGGKILTERPS